MDPHVRRNRELTRAGAWQPGCHLPVHLPRPVLPLAAARADRLRAVTGRAQTLLNAVAAQGERIEASLRWPTRTHASSSSRTGPDPAGPGAGRAVEVDHARSSVGHGGGTTLYFVQKQ